jgi:CTD kinase subunit gamma
LENWKTKRIIDGQRADELISTLDTQNQKASMLPSSTGHSSTLPAKPMARDDIFRRIEEDRERHKRLREKRWVQPVSQNYNPTTYRLASFMPLGNDEGMGVDLEFDDAWETTSDWNEDDDDAIREETELCFHADGDTPMDLT